MKRKKVYLRAYFNHNLGDDIFIRILAERYPEVDFLCIQSAKQLAGLPSNLKGVCSLKDRLYYRRCRKKGDAEKSGDYDTLLETKAIKSADCTVYITGSGFMEKDYPIYRDRRDRAFFKSKPYLIGCNFGPYETDAYLAKHRKYFLCCKDVCFRDSYSKRLFGNVGRLESDIVFSYAGEKEYAALDSFGKYQVIAPVRINDEDVAEKYKRLLRECIASAGSRGIKTVLAAFCKGQGDLELIDEIKTEECLVVSYPDISMDEMVGIIKNAVRVISVRYHAAVLGLLYRVPISVIAYNEKIDHVLDDIDENIKYLHLSDIQGMTGDDFLERYCYEITEEKINCLRDSSQRQFAILDEVLK